MNSIGLLFHACSNLTYLPPPLLRAVRVKFGGHEIEIAGGGCIPVAVGPSCDHHGTIARYCRAVQIVFASRSLLRGDKNSESSE